jgi:hypothetical protein
VKVSPLLGATCNAAMSSRRTILGRSYRIARLPSRQHLLPETLRQLGRRAPRRRAYRMHELG